MIKSNFKLPSLKGRVAAGARVGRLPAGKFLVNIERCFPFEPRTGNPAIRVEFTVEKIEKQAPYTTPETGISNEVAVGDRRQEWFEMGGEYGYGEAEWASLLRALGATDEDIDQAQDAALQPDNPLRNQKLWVTRSIQLNKKGGVFIKPSFEAV